MLPSLPPSEPRPSRWSFPWSLWRLLTVREWRHHPWRHGMALLAVALGVALAYSVHLINQSALNEFSQAVRTAGGQPDISLRGSRFDDAFFERVAADPAVEVASPVLEVDTYARSADGRRVAVRVLGLDALRAAPIAIDLMPRVQGSPATGDSSNNGNGGMAFLNPDLVFLNAAAQSALGGKSEQALPAQVALQAGAT